jgi:hypothetical protein
MTEQAEPGEERTHTVGIWYEIGFQVETALPRLGKRIFAAVEGKRVTELLTLRVEGAEQRTVDLVAWLLEEESEGSGSSG